MSTPKGRTLSASVAFVLIAETAQYRAENTTDPEAKRTLLNIREYAVSGRLMLEQTSDSTVPEHAEIRSENS